MNCTNNDGVSTVLEKRVLFLREREREALREQMWENWTFVRSQEIFTGSLSSLEQLDVQFARTFYCDNIRILYV